MAMTAAYLALLLLVGLGRLLELRISRRNRRRLTEQGAGRVYEPHFRWMVLLHAGVLAGAAAEVLWLKRPLIPALAVPMFVLFVLASLLRWWVIRTLAGHWNVGVMKSSNLGVVTSGPYRWIRHPNYVAVATELFALPMIHTAWITAVAGTAVNLGLLRRRLRVEDAILLAHPGYRAAMGAKPRFFPRIQ
jgi:methyltransferase